MPSPYQPGLRLTLSFTPEGSISATTIEVRVIRTFEPYTLAQCMLVEPCGLTGTSHLPPRLVLKLVDPRFSVPQSASGSWFNSPSHASYGLLYDPDNEAPQWTHDIDRRFMDGLERVRRGEWANYWTALGASEDVPPTRRQQGSTEEQDAWMAEVDRWKALRSITAHEAAAYRRLHDLQGVDIPRLYGSCVYSLDEPDPQSPIDPFVTTVPGLLLEYIDGTPLSCLAVGADFAFSDAQRVSQGALRILRQLRDRFVLHGDFAPRNVVVRLEDLDHPVVIDLGSARVPPSSNSGPREGSLHDWIEHMVADEELVRARATLAHSGFHIPSPIPEKISECAGSVGAFPWGYWDLNMEIEALRPEWRAQLYEPQFTVPPPRTPVLTGSGKQKFRYEPLLWRIRPGTRTANASADYRWGKPRYGWSMGPTDDRS